MQEVPNANADARELSRREFISSIAAGTAGVGFELKSNARATNTKAKTVSSADKIHVALIGCGAQGRKLIECLGKIDIVKLVAVVDIWPYARQFAQRFLRAAPYNIKVNIYENYEELLEKQKDLQAVIVATPDFWHAPITNACLRAGLHVYCETAMSHTIEGAKTMVEAARETGSLLQIGYQRRSNPRYLFVRNQLIQEANIFGRITATNAQWNCALSEGCGWPKNSDMTKEQLVKYGFEDMHHYRNWRWFKKYCGGPLSDLGAHQIDIYNWWLGSLPVNVIAAGGLDYYKDRDWFDNALVVYEYHLDGATSRAFFQVLTTTSAGGNYDHIMGTEATLHMSETLPLIEVFPEPSRKRLWHELITKNHFYGIDVCETCGAVMSYGIPLPFSKLIHLPHMENFFQAIKGTAKLNCPADEAYRSELVIFKAVESIRARRMIEITPSDIEVT